MQIAWPTATATTTATAQSVATFAPSPPPATSATAATPPVPTAAVTTTPDGLKIEDLRVGTGDVATPGKTVTVDYTGWLIDGTKFDSSKDHGQQPFSFALGAGQVIRGWDEGVAGMKVGGTRKLTIPPELAYGSRAVGGVIPANSTLVFEVELHSVQSEPSPAESGGILPATAAPTQTISGGAAAGQLRMYGVYDNAPSRGLAKLFNAYRAKNAGTTIDYHYFPNDKFVALFTAAQNSGEQIDLVISDGQFVRKFVAAGNFMLLDDVPFKDRFWEFLTAPFTFNGHLWAVPMSGGVSFPVFINGAVLDSIGAKPPETYKDLVALRDPLKAKGVSVFTHPGKQIFFWPVWFFTTYAQATKNQSLEKTVATLTGNGKFTDPEVVQGIDLIFQYQRDGLFAPDIMSSDTTASTAALANGKAAFWMFADVLALAPLREQSKDLKLDTQLMPALTDDTSVKRQLPGAAVYQLAMWNKIQDASKPAAVTLMDYLTTDESDTALVDDGKLSIPVNKNVKGSSDPVAQKIQGFGSLTVPFLDWYWPPEITTAFQENLQAGILGQKKAEDAAKDIQTTWEKVQAGGFKFL